MYALSGLAVAYWTFHHMGAVAFNQSVVTRKYPWLLHHSAITPVLPRLLSCVKARTAKVAGTYSHRRVRPLETILNFFAVKEENGADGTDAPDTVALIRDQLVYMSRSGAKTTLTKAQIQTILSTEGLTDLIQPDISQIGRAHV